MAAAGGTLLICLFLMSPLLIYCEDRVGNQHLVGDEATWAFGIKWPRPGQTFLAGDILLFKYSPGAHNVVRVDAKGYDTCRMPANPEIHSSGSDSIKLNPGNNYFICGVAGHCSAGMKIVVTAE